MCVRERERKRESPVRLGRVVNPESIYPNQLEKGVLFFLGGNIYFIFSYQLPFHKD